MKNLLILITGIVVFSGIAIGQGAGEKAEWKEFQSTEEMFKVEFPHTPVRKLSDNYLPDRVGQSIEYDTRYSRIHFIVRCSRFSSDPPTTEKTLNQNYDSIRDGIFAGGKREIVSDMAVTVSGILGREIVSDDQHLYIRNRIFIFGNQLYFVIADTHSNYANDPDIQKAMNRFMNSFQLRPSRQ
jgi:hypothetical protein